MKSTPNEISAVFARDLAANILLVNAKEMLELLTKKEVTLDEQHKIYDNITHIRDTFNILLISEQHPYSVIQVATRFFSTANTIENTFNNDQQVSNLDKEQLLNAINAAEGKEDLLPIKRR